MAEPDAPGPEPARIIIVDDEPSVCRSIEKVLNRAGYRVTTSPSVSAALQILQADGGFKLIITDLMMPQVNGMELLKIAKTCWPHIPVLVITGYASIASAVEATQLGAANYLAKPFTPQELQEAVLHALTPASPATGESADETRQTTSDERPSQNLEDVEEAVVGHWAEPELCADAPTVLVIDNEVVVVNSVRKILTRKGYRVEAAFTGQDALQRIQDADYALILMDMRLTDFDGLQLLPRMRDIRPGLKVLVVTGYASLDTAVEAIRKGAADYMAKPFTPDELLQAIAKVLQRQA